MNKLLIGLGAYLLWRVIKMEWRLDSAEEATADTIADFDRVMAANIKETAQHMGCLYNENHYLGHQIDLLRLDYLHHLKEAGHWDTDNSKIIQLEPYIVGEPDPTALEMEMKEDGLCFETRRLRGL